MKVIQDQLMVDKEHMNILAIDNRDYGSEKIQNRTLGKGSI